MSAAMTFPAPLRNVFINTNNSLIKKIGCVLGGVLVLAFASQMSIPLQPVPLTFQSATVILLGMAFGPRYGSYVILSYFFAGLCGVPVFADFSFGIQHFMGPTAGYLIGFLPAAFLSGYLAQHGFAKSIVGSFIAALLGVSVIFALGIAVLSQFFGLHNAINAGLMPFIISEPIKLMAAALIIPRLWKQSTPIL